MEKKEFSEKESLAIINEMISRARNNVQCGAGNSMIFWGIYTSAVAVLNFVLLKTLSAEQAEQSFAVWSLMVVAGIIFFFITRKKRKITPVKTHIDTITDAIWRGYMVFTMLLLVLMFAWGYVSDNHAYFVLLTPIILLAVGMAEYATAKALRFKSFLYGATIMWCGALICTAIAIWLRTVDYQFVVFAICMLLGFVATGFLLNKQAQTLCSES